MRRVKKFTPWTSGRHGFQAKVLRTSIAQIKTVATAVLEGGLDKVTAAHVLTTAIAALTSSASPTALSSVITTATALLTSLASFTSTAAAVAAATATLAAIASFTASAAEVSTGTVRFLPLGGNVLWLRADLGVTLNSGHVSAWSDEGPSGNNAAQGTSANQPTYSSSSAHVNNQASLSYSTSDPDFLSISNASSLQITGNMFFATVVYIASYTVAFATMISKGAVSEYDFYILNTQHPRIIRNGSVVLTSSGAISNTAPVIISYNQSGGTGTLYINGTADSSASGISAASTTTNAVLLGKRSDNAVELNGEQPEVVLFNRALSTNELTVWHEYLGARYGISVP